MTDDIYIKLVETKEQKNQVKHIIENYHSYVRSNRSVGRRIDCLVYNNKKNTPLGMIGIGSSVYPPPKDILKQMNLSKDEYKIIFNEIANNWRFCMVDNVKNAGTQILKKVRRQAPYK